MNKIKTLKDLLTHSIIDLHSAETQLLDALPKVAKAATDASLRSGAEKHLEQTKEHVKRLEEVIKILGEDIDGRMTCKGMQGLIEESEKMIEEKMDPEVKDAALIGGASKIKHYEMAGYMDAVTLSEKLGLQDAVKLLTQTLEEEVIMAEELEKLSMG